MWAYPSLVLHDAKSPDHLVSSIFEQGTNARLEFRRYKDNPPSLLVMTNPSPFKSITLIGSSP